MDQAQIRGTRKLRDWCTGVSFELLEETGSVTERARHQKVSSNYVCTQIVYFLLVGVTVNVGVFIYVVVSFFLVGTPV
jgi:hypothetical protein